MKISESLQKFYDINFLNEKKYIIESSGLEEHYLY